MTITAPWRRLEMPRGWMLPATLLGGGLAGAALALPVAVIGTLFLALLGVLVIRWPQPAAIFLFLLIPFQSFITQVITFRGHVQPQPFTLWKDLLIGAFVLRVVYTQVRRHGLTVPRSGADLVVMGYVLWLASVAAASPELKPAGYALALEAEGPLLFLALVALRPSRRVIWSCLAATLAAAVVLAAMGVWEQTIKFALPRWFGVNPNLINQPSFATGSSYRSGSLFADPLLFGIFMGCVAPLAFAAVFIAPRRLRLGAAVIAALCVAGLVVSYTRSGYLGAGVGMMAFILAVFRNSRARLATLGIFLVIAGGAAALAALAGDERILHSGGQQAHIDIFNHSLDLISSNPLGTGLGTTDNLGRRFATPGSGVDTESAYLARGIEQGVVGLLIFIAVLMQLFLRVLAALRRARRAGDSALAALAAGALGAIVAMAVSGLFIPIRDLSIYIVVWGFAGLVVAATAPAQIDEGAGARARPPQWRLPGGQTPPRRPAATLR